MRPLICAHRGASAHLPDNSVEAFVSAIAMGADAIETDLRRTGDGRLVLAHDALPSRPLPGLAELGDLLELARGRVRLDIELKEAGYAAEVLHLLSPRPEGLLISSFLPDALEEVRAIDPCVRTGFIVGRGNESHGLFRRADECGADVLVPHVDLLDETLRRQALERRQPLAVWTVNDPVALARLIGDPAVGCVITDVPDVALALRRAA